MAENKQKEPGVGPFFKKSFTIFGPGGGELKFLSICFIVLTGHSIPLENAFSEFWILAVAAKNFFV